MHGANTKKLVLMGGQSTLHQRVIFSIEAEGIDIIRVETSQELLQSLVDYSPIDAILVDGDQKTYDFQNLIKKIKYYLNDKPLLIFTSQFRLGALANAVQSGFDEFLAKPVGEAEIKTLLNKYLLINK